MLIRIAFIAGNRDDSSSRKTLYHRGHGGA
jgi:hypothetical protein